MAKKATYEDYVITIEDNKSVHVTKDGKLCGNTSAALRDIAKAINFELDPKWGPHRMGANIYKAIIELSSTIPNSKIAQYERIARLGFGLNRLPVFDDDKYSDDNFFSAMIQHAFDLGLDGQLLWKKILETIEYYRSECEKNDDIDGIISTMLDEAQQNVENTKEAHQLLEICSVIFFFCKSEVITYMVDLFGQMGNGLNLPTEDIEKIIREGILTREGAPVVTENGSLSYHIDFKYKADMLQVYDCENIKDTIDLYTLYTRIIDGEESSIEDVCVLRSVDEINIDSKNINVNLKDKIKIPNEGLVATGGYCYGTVYYHLTLPSSENFDPSKLEIAGLTSIYYHLDDKTTIEAVMDEDSEKGRRLGYRFYFNGQKIEEIIKKCPIVKCQESKPMSLIEKLKTDFIVKSNYDGVLYDASKETKAVRNAFIENIQAQSADDEMELLENMQYKSAEDFIKYINDEDDELCLGQKIVAAAYCLHEGIDIEDSEDCFDYDWYTFSDSKELNCKYYTDIDLE